MICFLGSPSISSNSAITLFYLYWLRPYRDHFQCPHIFLLLTSRTWVPEAHNCGSFASTLISSSAQCENFFKRVGDTPIKWGFILNLDTHRILWKINWLRFLQKNQCHLFSSAIFPIDTDLPPSSITLLTKYTTWCCESNTYLGNINVIPSVVYDFIQNHLYMTFLVNEWGVMSHHRHNRPFTLLYP